MFYLKEEYNTEEYAKKIANFCSRLYLKDIVKLFTYNKEDLSILIQFDEQVVQTFGVDLGFVAEFLAFKGRNDNYPFQVIEAEEGLLLNFTVLPRSHNASAFLLLMKDSLEMHQINGLVNAVEHSPNQERHPALIPCGGV